MAREMTVQVRPIDGGLAVSGELDLATSEEFHNIAGSKISSDAPLRSSPKPSPVASNTPGRE